MDDRFGGSLAGSFALHAVFAALLLAWAYLSHSGQSWGNSAATARTIQATMVPQVPEIPLPPKAPMDQNNVLATENPSPAPITPEPKTVEVPQPNAIPIPAKPTKPAKLADKTTPAPPLHPQPVQIQPNKVQAGEGAGARIAMSSTQNRAGTFSVGTPDAGFGSRFAWYVQQITGQVAQQWYTGMLDPQAPGHRVYITFQIERDGSVTDARIAQPSGDATLDQTALNAVLRSSPLEGLPPDYAGSHINVTFYFDPSQHP